MMVKATALLGSSKAPILRAALRPAQSPCRLHCSSALSTRASLPGSLSSFLPSTGHFNVQRAPSDQHRLRSSLRSAAYSSSLRGERLRSSVTICHLASDCRRHLNTKGKADRAKLLRASATDTSDAMSSREIPMFPTGQPKISVVQGDADSWQGDLLAFVGFNKTNAPGDEGKLDNAAFVAAKQRFAGDGLESVVEDLRKPGSSGFTRVAGVQGLKVLGIVGVGDKSKATASATWGKTPFQVAGEAIAAAAKTYKAAKVGIALIDDDKSLSSELQVAAIEKLALGVQLGGYAATRFKSKAAPSHLKEVEIVNLASVSSDQAAAAVDRAAHLARGVLLARYLVETPANICNPTYLADCAKQIADSASDVMKLEVLEREQCEELGMGLYLGVAECSATPPKFIHLTYAPPGGSSNKTIGLVGKGLTFDTGGYNLKVSGMIERMGFDMAGAGAILGAAQALALLKPPGVTIHIISASCENMIDGKGMRPGDVLTAASGKTVEVDNTDAEGRLTLADALWYAQNKCGVQAVVDIATLTGACMVGLGKEIAGLFTPSEAMAEGLKSAAQTSGEKLWRLPMEETYREILDSPIADMKNTGIGTRFGGAITASIFLKEFVETDKVEWAHVDIAGPAWNDKAGGATGYGALLLTEWAISQSQQ
ncbi:hypothetical protein WJX73_003958 [Symbiochloris irregularis]|uniref:Cytosol aminopeptidase domain-containing protein n=1 Tax=Symbiochloris irregularis TaxID=706552 RepID=A0AAW1PEN7_9CHLO